MTNAEPTHAWLDHYVNECLQQARNALYVGNHELVTKARQKLVDGLREKLQKGMEPTEEVTVSNINEIIELAQPDWTRKTLIAIDKRYCVIRGKAFDADLYMD